MYHRPVRHPRPMAEIDLMDRYPRSRRPIEERAETITEEHRRIARRFGREFFDGDRLFGYGGYSYHPRYWTDTVRRLRDHYDLPPDASILDVGCAKGFMLYDFHRLMPEAELVGVDVSEYAIEHAIEPMRPYLQVADAADLPFEDDRFDLVVSINSIHNLPPEGCRQALREIERVGRAHKFVVVDAWRNEQERQALEKWNLTAKTMMHVDDWKALFDAVGYTGDYYWFIAQSE